MCITVRAGHGYLVSCLRSVLEHTAAEVPILVCDDASPDSRSRRLVLEGAHPSAHRVRLVGSEPGGGLAKTVNAAFAMAAPADMVVLGSDCIVADGWLDGLRDAAYVDARVATAMSLIDDRALATGYRPDGSTFDEAAGLVRSGSLRVRPRVPTAGGPCLYVRRSALELVGDFDLASWQVPRDELDFSRRCLQSGLCHVVADDVLVLQQSETGSPADGRVESTGLVACSVGAARRALNGLSVVIDARILAGPMNGTKVHVLELIAAVARTRQVRVTAIVPAVLSGDARALLETLPDVALTTDAAGTESAPTVRADIAHRPFQISAPADLTVLARLADRLIITQQDLIGYHNPSYFPSSSAWQGYRDLTRRSLAAADRVLFFSRHVRDDALAENLVEPHRASVVHLGVDHGVTRVDGDHALPPSGAGRLPDDAEMMLCLGTDYRHKNRIFALRILDELQRRHAWAGWLVMAGPRVAFGSSIPDEQRLLAMRPRLTDVLLNLDEVSGAEKTWLLRRASLVLYPTVHEGFGLVPFEAADHDVPCLWAGGTALSEVLPDAVAGIIPWDAAASADRALELMRDERVAASSVQAVRAAGAALVWDATAFNLIEVYHSACKEPPTPASTVERMQGLMQSGLSEDGTRLVGPDGVLPHDLERPLLALATHPKLGAPVFGAIKAGYRASYRWRRTRLNKDGNDA